MVHHKVSSFASPRAIRPSFLFHLGMLFMGAVRFCIHVPHAFHHRTLGHRFFAHLHVLHHVLHHLLFHLCPTRVHRNPLFRELGDEGGHQGRFFVLGSAIHPGDLRGELGVLRLHLRHHFFLLRLHLLAALLHLSLHHHLSFGRLGRLRLDGRPKDKGKSQGEAGADDEFRFRLVFHVLHWGLDSPRAAG